MQTRFLLGPAGSGKTFRCLAEIRAELLRDPAGPPLLLLAPKQATFQLERQLLDNHWWSERARGAQPATHGSSAISPLPLHGYTRLQILSFDRLAHFILTELGPTLPQFLDDEGRVMVLRALLARHRSDLKLFRSTAHLPGFATRLSRLLRELQRHQLPPKQLAALGDRITSLPQLRDKLHDFALLLRAYQDWLQTHSLHDADSMIDEATALLRAKVPHSTLSAEFRLAGLWLDGFAEMTAQELDLLSAVIPLCDQAALAFCVNEDLREEPGWLSTWSVVGQTYVRCHERIGAIHGMETSVEILPKESQPTRFTGDPYLAALESNWSQPSVAVQATSNRQQATSSILPPPSSLVLFSCANPDAEATLAAREIRRFIRTGGRFREAAVLVRSLDDYANSLRRVFARYEIPCFIDRREPVAHHPLAELTRYALRLGAYGWRKADWFGALKTGFTRASESEIDWLENLALEFGWDGIAWHKPLEVPGKKSESARAEQLRLKLIPPFLALAEHTRAPLTGKQLADALRGFWSALGVEATLEHWTELFSAHPATGHRHSAVHATVLDQLHAWLENLERAFPATPAAPASSLASGAGVSPEFAGINARAPSYSVREWLPILESGLATLTVGVIPPALDQVLIGAIDRSRNPELKLALVPGLNEGVFPAPPQDDPLLNELERDVLLTHGARLGPDSRRRLGHEWFYGYIACTRASQRLVLTCAEFDLQGNKLNRSPFFDHLAKIFPNLKLERWHAPAGFAEAEHLNEIIAPAIQVGQASRQPSEHFSANRETPPSPDPLGAAEASGTPALLSLPELPKVLSKARAVANASANEILPPALVEELHGPELATSVSGLEDFAACPFKFFVSRSLRAEERKRFELDARERGSFQHDVLQAFHLELLAQKLKWRDVAPVEACERVRRIGSKLLAGYRHGLFAANASRRFAGELLLRSLETLIAVLVTWAKDYRFDPELVEAGFGLPDAPWPAWKLSLADGHSLALRGRIDRVDVWRDETTGTALAVVMDYKSSSRKPDRLKLQHGLQLQLPAYLNVLARLPEVRASLQAGVIKPAGVFYVNLRGEFASVKSRAEALTDVMAAVRQGFQHQGRYDDAQLPLLDPFGKSEQFKTGSHTHDRLGPSAFTALLECAVKNLKRFGNEIYSGKIAPAPFRKGGETACDFCDYRSICRFDPWTQPFRTLKAADHEA